MIKNFSEKKQKFLEGISVRQIILVAGSSLLLLVFLAPNLVQQIATLTSSSGSAYATTKDFGTLSIGELEEARKQIRVLEHLQRRTAQLLNTGRMNEIASSPILLWLLQDKLDDPAHWWLLCHEAQAGGLVGGAGDGRALLDRVAPKFGITPDQLLAELMGQSELPARKVLTTLADLSGVERLMTMVVAAPRAGVARQKHNARELLTTVSCEVVPIRASAVGDLVQVADPTPLELDAQYLQARDFLEGQGPAGAGYMSPDRVRVEWLSIPAIDIAHSVEDDPALGPVELRKEFLKNPMRWAPAQTDPTAPAVQPRFEDVKENVANSVKQRLAAERTEKIAAFIRDWNRAALKDAPSAGGTFTLPADWAQKQPTLISLAEELTNRFKLRHPPKVDGSGPDPLPVKEAATSMWIGPFTTTEYGQPVTVATLLPQLHELNPESRLPFQVGVVGPVVYSGSRDLAAFRVVAAYPAAAPKSLSDVQQAVIRDAMTSLRYAALVRKAPEILARAESAGLTTVATEFNTIVEQVPQLSMAQPMMLLMGRPPSPGALSAAGSDIDAVRTVIQRAVTLPMGVPLSTVPDSQRMLTVAVPSKQVLLIVKINEVKPVALEDWTALSERGAISTAMSRNEERIKLPDLFGKEEMRKRHGFVVSNPEGPDRVIPQAPPIF